MLLARVKSLASDRLLLSHITQGEHMSVPDKHLTPQTGMFWISKTRVRAEQLLSGQSGLFQHGLVPPQVGNPQGWQAVLLGPKQVARTPELKVQLSQVE